MLVHGRNQADSLFELTESLEGNPEDTGTMRRAMTNCIRNRATLPAVWLMLAGMTTTWIDAASEMNFPVASFEPGIVTGIAIVNPNPDPAPVTLAVYGVDGALVKGLPENPIDWTIPAGSQMARTVAEWVGSGPAPDTVAWIQATSESDDVTGFFLALNSSITWFDGADLPPTGTRLAFHDIRTGDGRGTTLYLLNPGEIAANVTLERLEEGSSLDFSFQLPAKGIRVVDPNVDFGAAPDSAKAVWIEVRSDQPVAGFQFVSSGQDWHGINARPVGSAAERLVFPQMAVLSPFVSELFLVNYDNQATLARVTARRPDGSLHTPATGANPKVVALLPRQALRADLEVLFGFAGNSFLEGWLEVSAESPQIDGTLVYSIPSLGSVAAVAAPLQGMRQALFAHLATALDYFTGLALLNPGSLTATCRTAALDPGGKVLGSSTLALPAGRRSSLLITEMIQASAGYAGGFIWVDCDQPTYMTSLFGSSLSGVLANIPPQAVPADFVPETLAPALRIQPRLAVLQPSSTQAFQAEAGRIPDRWFVNGVAGGSAEFGTISPQGLYRAPAQLPEMASLAVTASDDGETAGASVDLLSKAQLLSGLGTVQALAYLERAQTLFTSELSGSLGSSGGISPLSNPAQSSQTLIRDVTSGTPVTVATLAGENVPGMLALTGPDGREYLLLVGQNSGTLRRFDPVTRTLTTVTTGLDSPVAAALDEADQSILVAEADQVRTIPLADVLPAQAGPSPMQQQPGRRLFSERLDQVVVDRCTGNLYGLARELGVLVEFSRTTGYLRQVAEGLQQPNRMLGVYRRGVGCPQSFQLLVLEQGTGTLTLLEPATRTARRWLDVDSAGALLLLPAGNPLTRVDTLLVAESPAGAAGRLLRVNVPDLYVARSVNPPELPVRAPCLIRSLGDLPTGPSGTARLSGDGNWVYFSSKADPAGKNDDGNEEAFLLDRARRRIQQLTATNGGATWVRDVVPDGSTVLLESTAGLTADAPVPASNLYLLNAADSRIRRVGPRNTQGGALDDQGRIVLLAAADNPLQQNPDGQLEVFGFDTVSGGLIQLTNSETGFSGKPALSGDGRVAALLSTVGPEAGLVYLYRRTLDDGRTVRVAAVGEAKDWEQLPAPLLNRDGSVLLFSTRHDLLGENPLGRWVVYRFEPPGAVVRVSSASADTIAAELSGDGRTCAVTTRANPSDLNPDRNLEIGLLGVFDRSLKLVTRSRRTLNLGPSIAGPGTSLVFRSNADPSGNNPGRNLEVYVADCLPE